MFCVFKIAGKFCWYFCFNYCWWRVIINIKYLAATLILVFVFTEILPVLALGNCPRIE